MKETKSVSKLHKFVINFQFFMFLLGLFTIQIAKICTGVDIIGSRSKTITFLSYLMIFAAIFIKLIIAIKEKRYLFFSFFKLEKNKKIFKNEKIGFFVKVAVDIAIWGMLVLLGAYTYLKISEDLFFLLSIFILAIPPYKSFKEIVKYDLIFKTIIFIMLISLHEAGFATSKYIIAKENMKIHGFGFTHPNTFSIFLYAIFLEFA